MQASNQYTGIFSNRTVKKSKVAMTIRKEPIGVGQSVVRLELGKYGANERFQIDMSKEEALDLLGKLKDLLERNVSSI